MRSKRNSKTFILLFLGLLSAFGPFVMDMYLPTLPAMSVYFRTTSSMVQLGLTTSMAGLAAGQLFFGPLSDKYGRRPVLSVALMLFLLSTAGCIFSENILQFITLRFLQGVSGAGGVVLSRSIAADKYSARELAGVLAVIGGINGVATVAAPIAGGFLADASGWQGIFWSLFLLGTILLAGSFRMEESHPAEQRTSVRWNDILRNFSLILRNRQYLAYTLQYGFTMGVLFVNIASAPFIMQEHYGLSAMQFSLCFGANAIAMAIASTVAVKLPTMKDALYIGSSGMLWLSFAWFAALSQGCSFWIYETLVFALLSMAGITFTASNTLAMECERENAGVASALLGTAGFAVGGIMSPLVGLGNILFSTGMLFIFSSFLVVARFHPWPHLRGTPASCEKDICSPTTKLQMTTLRTVTVNDLL